MPSPSSPLEYRPTPHLVLIILFIVFPIIYLCARLTVTGCQIFAFVLKTMFTRLIQFLYEDEYSFKMRSQSSLVPTSSMASSEQEVHLDEISSDEEFINKNDEEPELMITTNVADDTTMAHPETFTDIQTDQQEGLEIDTDLYDSEHDSGNEEEPPAVSGISTVTTVTNQTPNVLEIESVQNCSAFNRTNNLRRRENAALVDDP